MAKVATKKKVRKKPKPKVSTKEQQALALANFEEVVKLCGDDPKVAEFFVVWLETERNATKAYQKLHPDLSYNSAKTMGQRYISRVDRSLLMGSYDLGIDSYMEGLAAGLKAYKMDITGDIHPDFKTRREYHKALGQILGVEGKDAGGSDVNVTINQAIGGWVQERG